MDTSETKAKASSIPSSALKWLLSSGLLAAGTALLGTLAGLLYRVGWLDAFGISADVFMPNSVVELTLWGYVGLIDVWADLNQSMKSTYATFLLIALGYALFVFLVFLTFIWADKKKEAIKDRLLAFGSNKWAIVSLMSTATFAAISALPWLLVAATAVLVALPLPAFTAGKRAGEKAIAGYHSMRASETLSCHALLTPAGSLGSCPFVAAQTKDHIAFLDGDEVHVAPAGGVQIVWRLKTPKEKASGR